MWRNSSIVQQKEIKRKNYNEQWKRELQIEKEMEQTIKIIKTIKTITVSISCSICNKVLKVSIRGNKFYEHVLTHTGIAY